MNFGILSEFPHTMSSGQEAVNSLIRITGRGFYSTPYILVLEALLWHKVLSDDDLRELLNVRPKELRGLCSKLIEDRLVAEFKQREPLPEGAEPVRSFSSDEKEYGQLVRHISRTYYFIHNSVAIDSIKWKVDAVVLQVDNELSKTGKNGFICPRCKKTYSELDIQSLFNDDYTAAYCNICNGVLVEDTYSALAKVKHEKAIRLKGQLDPILKWLKKIDELKIEDNSIDKCFLIRIPASDTSTALYTNNTKGTMFGNNSNFNSNGSGHNQFENTNIRVNIAVDNEEELRKQEEKRKTKAEKAEQNALPSWYQESSVGKQSLGKLNGDEDSLFGLIPENTKPASIDADHSTKVDPASSVTPATEEEDRDELAEFYENLKQKQQNEADAEADDEDIDDGEFDDFDDFEDV